MPSRVNQLTRTIKEKIVYRDFTINLALDNQTGELAVNVNAQAVIQAITNLVLTYPTERYYKPLLGSTISQDLFDFVDQFKSDIIKTEIINTIQTYEPRAGNLEVIVIGDPTNHAYNVDIAFSIISIPNQRISVPTLVLRPR